MSWIMASSPPPTDSDIRELIARGQAGDLDAREKVFYMYLPLAYNRAEKYYDLGIPIDDLRQEASFGLLLALDRYDVNRSENFATLARHYIDKYLRKAVQKQNSNLPGSYKEEFYFEIKSYLAARNKLKEDLGREPSEQDMANCMNLSMLRIRRIKRAADAFLQPSCSYEPSWADNYCDSDSLRPLEDIVTKGKTLLDCIDADVQLTPREIEVLERRLGFNESGKPETWPYISAAMGLGSSTLQLTYSIAIAKLKKVMGLEMK